MKSVLFAPAVVAVYVGAVTSLIGYIATQLRSLSEQQHAQSTAILVLAHNSEANLPENVRDNLKGD